MFSHYIKLNSENYIIDYFSNGPHSDRDSDDFILLHEDTSYQFRFSPDGEENPIIINDLGTYLYYFEKDEVLSRSQDDINADDEIAIQNVIAWEEANIQANENEKQRILNIEKAIVQVVGALINKEVIGI